MTRNLSDWSGQEKIKMKVVGVVLIVILEDPSQNDY